MNVAFYDYHDPQYVELYDPQSAGSRDRGRYVHKYYAFTHSILTSAIQGHWSIDKRTEIDGADGVKYEIWQFDHELQYNLWRHVYTGMKDAAVKAMPIDFYVPIAE